MLFAGALDAVLIFAFPIGKLLNDFVEAFGRIAIREAAIEADPSARD